MSPIYTDKHATEITPGMTIRHDSGRTETILSVTGVPEDESLGIVAFNPNYKNTQSPDWQLQYYGLHHFDGREWEIISEGGE